MAAKPLAQLALRMHHQAFAVRDERGRNLFAAYIVIVPGLFLSVTVLDPRLARRI
jgi:hypothetical protein